MRKTLLLALFACFLLPAMAQKNAPKWLEKQRKAIVQITTYRADNQALHTGSGVFVSESGDVLTSYNLFKGATRATVTDSEGKTYPVVSIAGADDMYDVIKVKTTVPKKQPFLPIASEPLATGVQAYLVPFTTAKAGTFKEGAITEATKLKDPYGYYKINIPLEGTQVDAPLLTANGEVFGLAQADASGKKEHIYAVSAGYVNSLQITSVDMLNNTYTSLPIKKAWPSDVAQAEVMLFLLASSQDAHTYLETLNDFIATFPNAADGYQNRASHYAYNRMQLSADPAGQAAYLQKALDDMDAAVRLDSDKSEALYAKAKLIYGLAVADTTLTDSRWSLQAATDVLQQALKTKDVPLYHQLEGDIWFVQGDYAKAYDSYMILNNSDAATPSSFYWAAKAKENMPNPNVFDILNLLTQAIEKTKESPTEDILTYLLERVEYRLQIMQYEEAVADYDLYYNLVGGQVGAAFFYYREQAKFRQGDIPGALADIQEALKRDPNNASYLAEEASVYLRQEKYTDALASVEKAITLVPDFAACYRLQGLCYVRLGKKAEGCAAFQKAKELGDPVVDRLMKEHCE